MLCTSYTRDARRTLFGALVVVIVAACGERAGPGSGGDDPAGAGGTVATTGDASGQSGQPGENGQTIDAAIDAATDAPAGSNVESPDGPGLDAGVRASVRPMSLLEEMQTLGTKSGNRRRSARLHSRALRLHKRGRYKEAETIWGDAARADPAWERPFYNLACTTALQGRAGDALAYLKMVAKREIDYKRLRKVETDSDLASLRDRPELAETIEILAEQLLVGSYGPRDGQLFAGSTRAARCKTFTLDPHGKYAHGCPSKYATKGEWAYSGGILYLHIQSFQRDCESKDQCPQVQANAYDAFSITKLDDRDLCLERVSTKRQWPVEREIGTLVNAPRGTIGDGCYE